MKDKLPIRMLHDRLLVSIDREAGDRRSTGGIVIPATAVMGKRLAWARVEATGAQVRSVQVGDRVLFDPEDRSEVEVRGEDLILLRERDLHAVASERIEEGHTGLYL
ncbi:GroES family chaperonin [Aeromicrobium sp.]